MTPSDLDLTPTDDLVAALKRRFPIACIVAWIANERKPGTVGHWIDSAGIPHAVAKLAEVAAREANMVIFAPPPERVKEPEDEA